MLKLALIATVLLVLAESAPIASRILVLVMYLGLALGLAVATYIAWPKRRAPVEAAKSSA
jgi:hypothetical protein